MTIIVDTGEGVRPRLRRRVRDMGGYMTDTEAAQNAALSSEYRKLLSERRWPFLETTVAVPFTAGASDIDLSTVPGLTLGAIDTVRYEDGRALDYVAPDVFRRSTIHGWTVYGNTLSIRPGADEQGDVVVLIDYTRTDTDYLSSDASTCLIPEQYWDVLVWGAIRRLAQRERDPDTLAMATQHYAELHAAMVAQTSMRQRQTSEQVRSSGFYDGLQEPSWPI